MVTSHLSEVFTKVMPGSYLILINNNLSVGDPMSQTFRSFGANIIKVRIILTPTPSTTKPKKKKCYSNQHLYKETEWDNSVTSYYKSYCIPKELLWFCHLSLVACIYGTHQNQDETSFFSFISPFSSFPHTELGLSCDLGWIN